MMNTQADPDMKQPSEEEKLIFQQAMDQLNHGDPEEAIRLFEEVRRSWREDPDIYYLEGLAYGKIGDHASIMEVSRKALELQPAHFGALANLANVQFFSGEQESALDNYRKALELQPDAPEVLDNYGRALGIMGRREESITLFRQALAKRRDYGPAHAALGQAYSEAGQQENALREFRLALQLDPDNYLAHCGIAGLFTGGGGLQDAEHHYQEAIRAEKHGTRAYLGLASVQRYLGKYDKALELLDEAKQFTSQKDPALLAYRADCLERMGETERAQEIVNELAEAQMMNPCAVETYSKLCTRYDNCDEALELIDLSISQPATTSMEKQTLMYAAGSLLDKLGRYDEAFDYYHRANTECTYPTRTDYTAMYDNIIRGFSKEAMARLPRARTGSSRPVFILGMPRSGTTLTEQVLSSHPDVFGAGELNEIKKLTIEISKDVSSEVTGSYADKMSDIDQDRMTELANRYLDSLKEINSEARYVTDKMPHNFQHVGLISLLFPEARIIHCRRNPLDNGLSIFFQSFIWSHDYATDLADIGRFYKEYDRLMRYWEQVVDIPILTVQYEDMVEDQEGTSRRLLEFCDLDWDESVLNFHQSGRKISTASYDQVRQPLYKTSQARWKNYARHIKPLKEALPAHCVLGIEDIEIFDSL